MWRTAKGTLGEITAKPRQINEPGQNFGPVQLWSPREYDDLRKDFKTDGLVLWITHDKNESLLLRNDKPVVSEARPRGLWNT